MPAKFLRFLIRAALVFAIAVIVCRTASAAPAKTADRALEGIFRQTGVLKAEPRSRIYTNLLPDGHVFFLEEDSWGNILGEEYDPAKRTVADLGIILPRDNGPIVAATLEDGKYLLRLSGRDKRAAIFDAVKTRLTPKAYLRKPCDREYWNGRVLVSGGSRSDAELFDPATRRFSPAGS